MNPLDEVRLERDQWRTRALNAEAEVQRLKQLLGLAEDAIQAEYNRANGHNGDAEHG